MPPPPAFPKTLSVHSRHGDSALSTLRDGIGIRRQLGIGSREDLGPGLDHLHVVPRRQTLVRAEPFVEVEQVAAVGGGVWLGDKGVCGQTGWVRADYELETHPADGRVCGRGGGVPAVAERVDVGAEVAEPDQDFVARARGA